MVDHEKCRCDLAAKADLVRVKRILLPWKDTPHGKLFHEMQKVLMEAEKSTKAIAKDREKRKTENSSTIKFQIIDGQPILPKVVMQPKYCFGCGNKIKQDSKGEVSYSSFGGDNIYHHNCADTIRYRVGNP